MQKKPNPLEAAFTSFGVPGLPDIDGGKVPFHVLHVDGNRAFLAGVLLDHSGKRIGKVEIEGFPAGYLPASKPVGAPRKDEKHLAVLLAWALKSAELGGKMGEADQQIAALFDYSAADKVRKIRNPLAGKLKIDLEKDLLWIIDDSSPGGGPPACSVLVQKPTIYERPGGGFEILGIGDLWAEGCGPRVIGGRAFRIEGDAAIPGEAVAELMAGEGPKIISVIRPGR